MQFTNSCGLTLRDLPPSPPGKTGWPWSETVPPLPSIAPTGTAWPRISIVTPSFNQGEYLEATLRSVLLQGYPNLEYVVIDGGSQDNSRGLLERYAPYLTFWVSEKDRGHAHALNKGFAQTTGTIMAWLNSDDFYFPGALRTVAEVFTTFPEIRWLTSAQPATCDLATSVTVSHQPGFSSRFFKHGGYLGFLPHAHGWIQQESTFWHRSLWNQGGGALNEDLALAIDFELWSRFFLHTSLASVEAPLGCFRHRAEQRSVTEAATYLAEALRCLPRARPLRLETIAQRYRRSRFAEWLPWEFLMQCFYGQRVPVIVGKSGAWQKTLPRLI